MISNRASLPAPSTSTSSCSNIRWMTLSSITAKNSSSVRWMLATESGSSSGTSDTSWFLNTEGREVARGERGLMSPQLPSRPLSRMALLLPCWTCLETHWILRTSSLNFRFTYLCSYTLRSFCFVSLYFSPTIVASTKIAVITLNRPKIITIMPVRYTTSNLAPKPALKCDARDWPPELVQSPIMQRNTVNMHFGRLPQYSSA
mmetsp:Transcript_108144/g.293288  ORF Transcript_108144/g.293288 Transcript_108144/m.293288 type:complete len:203 (+) Transcript_108144:114-722(+)